MNSKNLITPVNLFSTSYEPKHVGGMPPIIFIHGILSSPYCWNKVKNLICDKTMRKAYAISLRNHGSSDWSEENSVLHMAADLKNFMLKKQISKAILIGHSLGGLVALAYAFENPLMVEKLIIEDMKLKIDDHAHDFKNFQSVLKMAANNLKDYPSSVSQAAAQRKLRHLFTYAWSKKQNGKPNARPLTPFLPFYKNKSGKFEWETNVNVVIKMFDLIQNFQVPVKEDTIYLGEALFIAAEYSNFDVLKQADLIKKHLPNSQVFCAKGVHHNCHLEKSKEYVGMVADFIAA